LSNATGENIATLRIFNNIEKAYFVSRPNRFVIKCLHNTGLITAYLPNPGRLWELLFENTTLYITKTKDSPEKHTNYMVIAVEKDGAPVFLHTHHTNTVVKWLIEKQAIPGLEEYSIEKPEFTLGKSRFDFLLKKGQEKMLLEVKSCTLFHDGIAMFPDAPTARGQKHIKEIARSSFSGSILFVVHSPSAEYFLPEYHIDPEFSKTLYESREDIFIKAVSVEWEKDLSINDKATVLAIPWNIYETESGDFGSYMLILNLDEDKDIEIGKAGRFFFRKGYYIYVGSAMKDLTARLERHKRKRKNLFWHVDYLREHTTVVHTLPIRSSSKLECNIASSVHDISDGSIMGFGSSDCNCYSHLFYMKNNPIYSEEFINLLICYRMDRIMNKILNNTLHK